jgi:Fe-S cluster biogenesis protein NfuA
MTASPGLIEERTLQQRLGRIGELVAELDQLPDPAVRGAVEGLVSTVLELHGAALAGILRMAADEGRHWAGDGEALITRLAAEPVIREVLLLHGLHPVALRTRVEHALDSVRPYMRSHGGGVELVEVRDEIVRLRLQGHCQGCPSSMMTLRLAVEKAIYEAAPDVLAIEVEESAEAAPPGLPAFTVCPLPMAAVAG